MSTRTSTTSVRIPGDLLDRFDRLAKATERTRSYHVIKALEAYIAEQDYLVNLYAEATPVPVRGIFGSPLLGGRPGAGRPWASTHAPVRGHHPLALRPPG